MNEGPPQRGASLVFWLLTVCAALPFWASDLLALTDWPHHLVGAQLALDFDDPARQLNLQFRRDLSFRPYLGATYLLMGLGSTFGLATGGKLLLSGYAVALCAAGRSLLRAAGRDPRLAWFVPLFVHQWALAYGFVPYVLSLPPALMAVAWTRRALEQPRAADRLTIAGATLVSGLMHPLGVLLAVVPTTGLLVAARAPWRRWRELGLLWAGLGVWGVLSARAVSREGVVFMDLGIETAWRWTIKHRLVDFSLAYLPGDLDYLVGLAGAVAIVVVLVLGRRQGRFDPLEGAALAMTGLYFVAPVNLVLFSLRMSLLSPRFVAPLWLFVLLLVRGRPGRVAWVGAIAALGHAGLVAQTHAEFGARWSQPVQAALERIPPGAEVRPEVARIDGSVLNPRTVRPPEAALHAYSMLVAGADPKFFSVPQGPLHILARTSSAATIVRWVQTSTSIDVKVD